MAWKEHSKRKHAAAVAAAKLASHKGGSMGSVDVLEQTEENVADRALQQNDISEYDTNDWTIILSESSYVPTSEDVGCLLRLEVSAVALSDGAVLAGPVLLFTEPVLSIPPAPPKRSLLSIPGPSGGGGMRFRVVTYNILAEVYATRQAYPYCDPWTLSWPFRSSILFQELEEAQGDVVCLQEVQADHYEQHLQPMMLKMGYDGIFKQKSRESMGQYGKVDGCATFWKRGKFMMLENYSIEFNDFARHAAEELGLDERESSRYINRLSKDNVAQIVLLEAISRSAVRLPRQSTQVCIANTHLYSNPTRPDVKLWQMCTLLQELENFVTQRDVALMLCGDFNSEPDSAVYDLTANGSMQSDHPEIESVNSSVRVLPDLNTLGHSLDIVSAMEVAIGEEPVFTNYTQKFKGCLDYMFYSPQRLRVMAISNIPEAQELEAQNGPGLPSAMYPSDHLLLCADVTFQASGNGAITRQQQQQMHLHNRGGNGNSPLRTKLRGGNGMR
jgi:CCR4-NOT transcription complex subunit 6